MNIPIPRGALVTGIVVIAGMGAVMAALLNNASPYGTFADARKSGNQAIHVAGELDKASIDNEPMQGLIKFNLKDQNGETMPVVYTGAPPANLSEATKIVAIGGIENGVFHSKSMLVKCPSKYEGEKGSGPVASNN